MNKLWTISIIAATIATSCLAADPAPAPAAPAPYHEWTLDEARKHAHERADELDKMTPEQYAAKQKKHHEWMDKWHAMTPEEKEAVKAKS